jgi:hypothetical protein
MKVAANAKANPILSPSTPEIADASRNPQLPLFPCSPNGRALPVHSCIIDGEAIDSNATGLAVFNLVRSYRNGPRAGLCAFDLIELDEEDQRWRLIEDRKAVLKKLISKRHPASHSTGISSWPLTAHAQRPAKMWWISDHT